MPLKLTQKNAPKADTEEWPFRAHTVFKDDHLASMVDAVLEEEEAQKKQTVPTL
eukprot:COSAG06_NODE_1909_length_8084_cov_66.552536_3_plen_54_part_00